MEATGLNGVKRSSTINSVTTGADPAVVAAQAAQGAAEAALAASEIAKITTMETKTELQILKTQIELILNEDTDKPIIQLFAFSIPKATITPSATVSYRLIATDNKDSELDYRYKVNEGIYSDWNVLTSENVMINLGVSSGLKEITIQVIDDSGNIATATATIFKI